MIQSSYTALHRRSRSACSASGEILSTPSKNVANKVIAPKLRELLLTKQEWREASMPIARGSVLGFIIGIIPGSAHIISGFLSYALERNPGHLEEFPARVPWAGVAGLESRQQLGLDRRSSPMLALGILDWPDHRRLDRRPDGAWA